MAIRRNPRTLERELGGRRKSVVKIVENQDVICLVKIPSSVACCILVIRDQYRMFKRINQSSQIRSFVTNERPKVILEYNIKRLRPIK